MVAISRIGFASMTVALALGAPGMAAAQDATAGSAASATTAGAAGTDATTASRQSELFKVSKPQGGKSEDITVVGSALGTANNQNANPVQIVTAKEIQQTSAVTIGDYLQRLPSIGSSAEQNTQPNGGDGISCTDIRNLGVNRVLVLVDGKRQVQTFGNGGSCVNLNSIPVDQVASIEILKDGGSELYGADAVSGVINIKLKHDLTSGGISMRGGITDVGDGQTGKLSAYKGMDFDQGRGNVTIFGQYMNTSGILQRNRPWSVNSWLADTQIGQAPSFGSSLTANTRVIDPNGNFDLVSNGTGGGAAGFHNKTAADNYLYSLRQSLTNELQESNLSGDAHYDVDPHVQLYANARYTHQTASNELAPLGITGASSPSTLLSSVVLPAGSPYNIWNEDVDLYKRFAELGDRRYSEAFDSLQVMGGVKGQIVGDWNYDASMTYGVTRAKVQTENTVNYRNLLQELGTDQLDPSDPNSAVVYNPSVCKASAGCALFNPFSPISGQALNYLRHTQVDTDSYQMRDFNLRTENNHLFQLPYAHGGDFGLAMGIEHRSEQANYSPDPLAVNGDLGGGGSYTGGGYNTTEAYVEGKLPLLHDAFLARDLTVDGQGRWSDYNTFGNTFNWKGSLNWAPTQDIRFRGTLGTSFRAPAISELYDGQGIGYYGGQDPCAQVSSYGSYSAAVQARCKSQGINTATFVNANSNNLPTLVGGNPKLQPEVGRTYTIGTVLTPRWIPGLSASVEYWHYTITNVISTVGGQYIVDECYTGQNTSFCNDIGQRSSAGQLTQVVATNMNLGGQRTNGIDFDLDYRIRLDRSDVLSLSNNMQQLIGSTQQNVPGGQWTNYTGRIFYESGSGNPRLRDYATATWAHKNLALTYMMNYTSGMIYNDGTNDVSCSQYSYCKVPGIFSHDVTMEYRLGRWDFQAGVNNILDKRPPFIPGSGFNTASGLYAAEIVGRFIFLSLAARF